MKTIAINASPMMDKGNTVAILTPFLDGMREAGTEVEVYYAKKLNRYIFLSSYASVTVAIL